eukprot:6065969-Pyramimonas_sp.AAC.1
MMRLASQRRVARTTRFGAMRRPSATNTSQVSATAATHVLSTTSSVPTAASDRSSIQMRRARIPVGLDCVILSYMK